MSSPPEIDLTKDYEPLEAAECDRLVVAYQQGDKEAGRRVVLSIIPFLLGSSPQAGAGGGTYFKGHEDWIPFGVIQAYKAMDTYKPEGGRTFLSWLRYYISGYRRYKRYDRYGMRFSSSARVRKVLSRWHELKDYSTEELCDWLIEDGMDPKIARTCAISLHPRRPSPMDDEAFRGVPCGGSPAQALWARDVAMEVASPPAQQASVDSARDELMAIIGPALKELTEENRVIFELHYLHEVPAVKIADDRGLSRQAISLRYRKVCRHIADHVAEEYGEDARERVLEVI